jgi:aryl-alcohol dehydrogenase-like predicted oxidoreductase
MTTWKDFNLGPFILGTAQLGFSYGIANKIGQPTPGQAQAILSRAWELGIRTFDTASAYGSSEQVLSACLSKLDVLQEAQIITKFPKESFSSQQSLLAAVDNSLSSLQCNQLFGVLAHSVESLQDGQFLQLLPKLKETGKVRFAGVSVYSVSEAKQALELDGCDLIQMPLNALDRRPIDSKLTFEAKAKGKLLMFRSPFLQGLLLLNPNNDLPINIEFARQQLLRWQQVCNDYHVAPQTAAIQIADRMAEGFPLVVGAESIQQIEENIKALSVPLPELDKLISSTEPISQTCTEQLLNPALW